jgi:hypothetical protein
LVIFFTIFATSVGSFLQLKGLDIKDYESLEKEIRKINNRTIKLATSMACFRASAAERCAFGLLRHLLTVIQNWDTRVTKLTQRAGELPPSS